jgi:hypothetical protein
MNTADFQNVLREIAASADLPESIVLAMYTDAVEEYRRDAHILDYVSLFAARRVRESLKAKTHQ